MTENVNVAMKPLIINRNVKNVLKAHEKKKWRSIMSGKKRDCALCAGKKWKNLPQE